MIMHVATECVRFPQGKHTADARNDYVLLCKRNSSNIPAIHVKAYPQRNRRAELKRRMEIFDPEKCHGGLQAASPTQPTIASLSL